MAKWRDVPGWEGRYEASTNGEIRSLDRVDAIGRKVKGRVLRGGNLGAGYRGYRLQEAGRSEFHAGHRLIAETFLGQAPNNKPWVNHKNGNKKDNRVSNLEWCSPSENLKHSHDSGLQNAPKGSRHHAAKLTDFSVRVIRRAAENGMMLAEIGAIFGVSPSVVSGIKTRRYWDHI